MILDRWLKPKWCHPDPAVRRTAIAELAADEVEVLTRVACDDAEPDLRARALARLTDFDLLRERMAGDPAESTRSAARQRLEQLLDGKAPDAPALAERLAMLERVADEALVEHVARAADEMELRRSAQDRISREPVLRDVVLGDAAPALRLAALERIETEAVLERIHAKARKHDKRVSRLAREKLAALREARERPALLAARCETVCQGVEAMLAEPAQDGHALRLAALDREWRGLDGDIPPAFAQRYSAVRVQALSALAEHQNRVAALEAQKTAIVAELESDLAAAEAPASGVGPDAMRQVKEARQQWAALPTLPEAAEAALRERLEAVCVQLARQAQAARGSRALEQLCGRFAALVQRPEAVAEKEVKSLGREWEALREGDLQADRRGEDPGAGDPKVQSLTATVERHHEALRKRLREQADWKDRTLEALPAELQALEAAVEAGDSKTAASRFEALERDLKALEVIGTAATRLAPLRSRARRLAGQVRVLSAWGRFGADQARERLCEEMEALAETDLEPPEIARLVREARARWKGLAGVHGARQNALWRRFDTAASAAYKVCEAYFGERKAERLANAERRADIATRLSALVEATDWTEVDWKVMVRQRRDVLAEWKAAFPVERKAVADAEARFTSAMGILDQHLDAEQARSLAQRERLIGEVEALASTEDARAAAEACKALQRRWVVSVPGGRRQENALWRRFQAACDAVFQRRRGADEDRAQAQGAVLEALEALVARLDGLGDVQAEALPEARSERRRIETEWREQADLPERVLRRVQQRFAAAGRRFDERRAALAAQAKQAQFDALLGRASLCAELESASRSGPDTEALVADLTTRWAALPALSDGDDASALTARFEAARARLGGPADTGPAPDPEPRETLCLRMEILAGVDSPPEAAAARMQYQVARLGAAFKGGDGTGADSQESLVRAWCTAPAAPPERVRALEERFQAALRKLP